MDIARKNGPSCVCHWMSPAPVVMLSQVPARAALGFMELRKSPYLVVLARGTVVGIVSRDHLQAAVRRGNDATTVAEVMRRDTPVLSAHDSVDRAAAVMIERRLSYVPVMDQGRLIGTLTMENVLRAVCKGAVDAASGMTALSA